MKYEVPGFDGVTISKYKVSFFKRKIKVYYVNSLVKNPLIIPYSKNAEKNLMASMERQIDKFVLSSEMVNKAYEIYSNNRSEFDVSSEELKVFNIKKMEVNANNIDNYSFKKLNSRLKTLRQCRNILKYMSDNGIYKQESKSKKIQY